MGDQLVTIGIIRNLMVPDEILPWFEKQKERRKEEKKKRKLPPRVLNSKWKVSLSRIDSAQNFRLR